MTPSTDLTTLAERFSIDGKVRIEPGPAGAPLVRIESEEAAASVALHGAQVLEWRPRMAAPVLWTSAEAYDAPGKPVRGGVPICWPWFGPAPEDSGLPAHGFARTATWELLEVRDESDGITVTLELPASAGDAYGWGARATLRAEITVGASLRVAVTTRNISSEPIRITQALHTYLAVGDIAQTRVLGLDARSYIDQLDASPDPSFPVLRRQRGDILIDAEIDRIYLDTEDECVVEDVGLGRRICVAKSGSGSTVVWNPWIEKAKRMTDFDDEEYLGMLCIETANAASDARELAPGAEHTLETRISVLANE